MNATTYKGWDIVKDFQEDFYCIYDEHTGILEDYGYRTIDEAKEAIDDWDTDLNQFLDEEDGISDYEDPDDIDIEDIDLEDDRYIWSSQDLAGGLDDKIWDAAYDYMKSQGFEDDEIKDYLFLDVHRSEYGDGNMIEVRAELSYEGLMDLSDKLDSVLSQMGIDSYFEPVDPGIIEAYVADEEI